MKFRVWEIPYNCYGDPYKYTTDADGNLYQDSGQCCQDPDLCHKHERILEYSTGLFDVNGTEIYEGDIMQFHEGHAYPYKAVKFDQLYDENADRSFLTWTAGSYSVLGNTCFPVIGNIHESPELLLMRRAKNE